MARREYLPALRGRFGDWAYYSVLMTLEQISARVEYASEIHRIRESTNLSELMQRELKEGRAKEIAEYLLNNEDRFFNSLVIAVYGGAPAWHDFDIKPTSPTIHLNDLSNTAAYSIGYLSISNDERLFALDGQHRLAGIKEAIQVNPELAEEEVSVIFVAHHSGKKGIRRSRKLFTTLNKTAKPVKKSEIIALDETDMMAISTRHLVENHRFFNRGQVDVMKKQANLHPNNYLNFTTIINLYDVLTIIFPFVKNKLDRIERKNLQIYRPSDEKVDEYNRFSEIFFEQLTELFPALKQYFESGGSEKFLKKNRSSDFSHILFRPVGLIIFSQLLKALRSHLSYEDAMALLRHLPVRMQDPPYRQVVWNADNTINNRGAALCRDLLLYMLGQYRGKTDVLKERYAKVLDAEPAKVKLPDRITI